MRRNKIFTNDKSEKKTHTFCKHYKNTLKCLDSIQKVTNMCIKFIFVETMANFKLKIGPTKYIRLLLSIGRARLGQHYYICLIRDIFVPHILNSCDNYFTLYATNAITN